MRILVTGGAGFIGSAFIRLLLSEPSDDSVANLDALTYAGNLENLAPVADDPRYRFLHVDLRDAQATMDAVEEFAPEAIVHFAAESHVDRSILSPKPVIDTNFTGTFHILEAAKKAKTPRFVHVSTDEVYGSIEPPHDADENDPLRASSPYSASKAGSDLLALSYCTTYKMNVSVTRASNNYGPYQFPEKLIPLMICNALEDQALPVYGDGQQVRDWLYVDDHARAIRAVLDRGEAGEIYNIGGSRALPNLDVVKKILAATGKPESLIKWVTDRPGHDRRYAITTEKVQKATGWQALMPFEEGLAATVAWYKENQGWVGRVRSGAYREWQEKNYGGRDAALSSLG
ncbi:MAG: dTDP-glucose 4,6-dehydratase [Bryobacterales bacterium]